MNSAVDARNKLIVALDVPTHSEAVRIVDELGADAAIYKIGLQLYTAAGPDVVRAVSATGSKVFLDLKLHDIPTTVAKAVAAARALQVAMLTVHLSGGRAMLEAASAEAGDLLVLGVTVLTSADEETLREVGVDAEPHVQVLRLARLGTSAGISGFVASAHEARALRLELGPSATLVTPGVRLADGDTADQKRIATPSAALAAGADYLVVGRPITGAPNRREALETILAHMMRATAGS